MKNKKRPKVLLISMPWAPLDEPSLGLGILSALLKQSGFDCTVKHFNLQLLRYLKWSTYSGIACDYGFNDYLFTAELDDYSPSLLQKEIIDKWSVYNKKRDLGEYRPPDEKELFRKYVFQLRESAVTRFLNDCLETCIEENADIIGFSCMYDQTISSLALAKKIKQANPEKFILFGGYAVTPPTGQRLMESFEWLDAMCYGEGENKIIKLVDAAFEKQSLAEIKGISWRGENGVVHHNEAEAQWIKLDNSPEPDYKDFFDEINALKDKYNITITVDTLPVESSRGCWWGQKSHCVFCGIDRKDLEYRSKSADVVLKMLDSMADKYGFNHFRFSDYILPNQYFNTLLPALEKHSRKYSLHWEIKSNLSLEKINILKKAGIKDLQPGIESFSTSLLNKMAKGVSGIQNVYTVKMLTQKNINVHYNILYGFPNEDINDMIGQTNLIPKLHHLPPPTAYEKISTTRFSPIYKQYKKLTTLQADESYNLVFSQKFLEQTGFMLEDYAYMFKRPFKLVPDNSRLYSIMVFRIVNWCNEYESGNAKLSFKSDDEGITFYDSRSSKKLKRTRFGKSARDLCLAVGDELITLRMLTNKLNTFYSDKIIKNNLDELVEAGFLLSEDGRCMNLAYPLSFYDDILADDNASQDDFEIASLSNEAQFA